MLNFSLQSVKWGNKTTLRACSQAQMESCAIRGSEGSKQHLMVPSCTECDERQSPESRMSRTSGMLWKGRRAALVLTDPWGPRSQAPGSVQLGLAGMPQHAQAGKMAGDMPTGNGCGRTFPGTFCFSGLCRFYPQSQSQVVGTKFVAP